MHKQLSLESYTNLLGSSQPSPGGGSAAAIIAANAIALCEMVCRLNAKRIKSYSNHWVSLSRAKRFEKARQACLNLSDADTRAFEAVSKYWKTGGEDLQQALKTASQTPLQLAELITQNAILAVNEIEPTSKHLISDLAEAGLFFKSTFESAVMNVRINLLSIEDSVFVAAQERKIANLKHQICSASDQLIASFALKHAE
ncbi:MAG: formiminotetrahydrofolate cyclodeaminase [Candidatus Omnitrophota bacterium]|jgi:formiminotetrahydrofolate cyclodeaminase